eukprot:237467_1
MSKKRKNNLRKIKKKLYEEQQRFKQKKILFEQVRTNKRKRKRMDDDYSQDGYDEGRLSCSSNGSASEDTGSDDDDADVDISEYEDAKAELQSFIRSRKGENVTQGLFTKHCKNKHKHKLSIHYKSLVSRMVLSVIGTKNGYYFKPSGNGGHAIVWCSSKHKKKPRAPKPKPSKSPSKTPNDDLPPKKKKRKMNRLQLNKMKRLQNNVDDGSDTTQQQELQHAEDHAVDSNDDMDDTTQQPHLPDHEMRDEIESKNEETKPQIKVEVAMNTTDPKHQEIEDNKNELM